MTATRLLQSTVFALVISSIPVLAQTPAAGTGTPSSPALAQAEQQLHSGQLDQALAAYQQALASTPDSAEANQGAGIALDLMGKHEDARAHFAKAASSSDAAAALSAQRATVVSYGFTDDCKSAEQYVTKPYNAYLDGGHFGPAADLAYDLGQVCFHAGDIDAAEKWFRMAYASALQNGDLKAPAKNLWDFRWNASMARVDTLRAKADAEKAKVEAAKKAEEAAKADKDKDKDKKKKDKDKNKDKKKDDKNDKNAKDAKQADAKPAPKGEAKEAAADKDEAPKPLSNDETPEKRMAAAAAALAKGVDGGDAAQLSAWVTGAVAFDQGDYQKATTELAKADQSDPKVLALTAQAFEKLGNKDQAQPLYQKILTVTAHTPGNAWARPMAKKALGKG